MLVGRVDLIGAEASPNTRARGLWSQGKLTPALEALEEAGSKKSAYAERLRSELSMLEPGFRLQRPQSRASAKTSSSDEPLRVLHLVTNSLPHTQSGYAVRTHNILTALRTQGIHSVALTRTGYPVMIGKPLCADEDHVEGVQYRRTLPASLNRTPSGRLDQEVAEAVRVVEEFRPHVLHATTDYRNALVAQTVSEVTGIPWILEVRGLMEKTWVASHRSDENRIEAACSEKVRRIAATETSLAREAGAVVTLSRTMAEVLIDRGVPEEKITLVPNGVDSSLLEENLSPALARTKLGLPLPDDALVVGSVSALVDYEGFDVLLRAVAEIIDDDAVPTEVRDRIYVVLVGDGVSAPALHALTRELGIQDRVMLPGRVSRVIARAWVQALDVVVVPRRDLEVSRTVTPQKPIEAMALSRPVVASDLPALRETIEDGNGNLVGVVVKPDDEHALASALAELLADPERRKKLSLKGREVAKTRTWAALMQRYARVYEQAMREFYRAS